MSIRRKLPPWEAVRATDIVNGEPVGPEMARALAEQFYAPVYREIVIELSLTDARSLAVAHRWELPSGKRLAEIIKAVEGGE